MALSGIKHIDVGTELTKTEWESEASHAIVAGTAFPTDPAPVEQQLFYRTDLHVLYIYNGSAWVSTDVTTHSALTTGVHGATGTVLHTSSTGLITYDLTDKFFLPYQVARKLYRYANEVFNTYDMISVSVTGTGVNQQAYMNPRASSGATSGGIAVQYQNAVWFYVLNAAVSLFITQAYLTVGTVDCTGFIGLALSDTHDITFADITKHAGFLFYVSGATTTIYASNADGSAQTKTDLSLSPITPLKTLTIMGDSTHIYYYVDWVLVATHTTNLPSGTLCWKLSMKSAEAGNVGLDCRGFVYAL